jgi:hypothetical protein
MPEDMMMMIPQAVSTGALGYWIGMVITWLRSKDFLGQAHNKPTIKALTLLFSYTAAFVTTMGVHYTFEGDFFAGGRMTIMWPDLQHMLEGAVLFAVNIHGQKKWANDHKSVSVQNHTYKILTRPEVEAAILNWSSLNAPEVVAADDTAQKRAALLQEQRQISEKLKALDP